jgi:hypothetical protein
MATPRVTAEQAPAVNSSSFGDSDCRCVENRTCRSCTQRRLYVWRLVDVDGLSCEEAAARVGLSARRVRVLVAYERDRRELEGFKLDSIPTVRAQAFLERELKRDPELTRAELAHRLRTRQADLDRQLGYEPTKNGGRQRRLGIPAASRLVIALGRAPHELDGC